MPASLNVSERKSNSARGSAIALRVAWVALLSLAAGCGGETVRQTGTVAGKIELDGKPLSGMQILFEDTKQGFRASAGVQDGNYKFESPLVVGNYQVAVLAPPAPPPGEASKQKPGLPAVPKKYLDGAKSGLTADVKSGDNTFDFKLKP